MIPVQRPASCHWWQARQVLRGQEDGAAYSVAGDPAADHFERVEDRAAGCARHAGRCKHRQRRPRAPRSQQTLSVHQPCELLRALLPMDIWYFEYIGCDTIHASASGGSTQAKNNIERNNAIYTIDQSDSDLDACHM